MSNTTTLSDAEAFFYEYAGFSYNPATETVEDGKRRGARQLATAEREAKEHDLEIVWSRDGESELDDAGTKYADWPHFQVIVYGSDGEILSSLSSIMLADQTDPWLSEAYRDPYARVVEAEVASEALSILVDQRDNEPVFSRKDIRVLAQRIQEAGEVLYKLGGGYNEHGPDGYEEQDMHGQGEGMFDAANMVRELLGEGRTS